MRKFISDHPLRFVFLLGVALRVVVFIYQSPFNNDDHYGVIRYIYEHHALPPSHLFSVAFHPPLYYVLASFLYPGGPKVVQLLSLGMSLATLFIICWLIRNLPFIQPLKVKKLCLMFACFFPQLIMFGNSISNDSMMFCVGALIFALTYRYNVRPTLLNQNLLAFVLGIGLLVKPIILAFIPALIVFVVVKHMLEKAGSRRIVFELLLFVSIFAIVGSYKFVDNVVHFGRPFVTNLDINPQLFPDQRPTYVGLRSLYDVNIFKLCAKPILSHETHHSIPLLLYGTFWYQYIPESNFKGNTLFFKYVGSMIYLFALIPMVLFTVGAVKIIASYKEVFNSSIQSVVNKCIFELFALGVLLTNLALVMMNGMKCDTGSAYQGRFFFAAFFAIIILLNAGLVVVWQKGGVVQRAVCGSLTTLYFLFVLYFGIEIWLQIMPYLLQS